jgi:hypothetical protein
MAIDLGDLIEFLQSEVDAPGEDSFPDASDDDWLSNLQSAFWEAVLDGVIDPGLFTESDGVITPVSGSTEISRELQQLIVFYAGVRVVRNKIRNMNTVFRAKAGPVEYETQQAATVLKALLDELVRKRNLILTRMSDLGGTSTFYVDSVIERDRSIGHRDTIWINY